MTGAPVCCATGRCGFEVAAEEVNCHLLRNQGRYLGLCLGDSIRRLDFYHSLGESIRRLDGIIGQVKLYDCIGLTHPRGHQLQKADAPEIWYSSLRAQVCCQ